MTPQAIGNKTKEHQINRINLHQSKAEFYGGYLNNYEIEDDIRDQLSEMVEYHLKLVKYHKTRLGIINSMVRA